MKTCAICNTSFNTRWSFQVYCSKECLAESGRRNAKRWQHDNYERAIARIKKWREANPEKVKSYEAKLPIERRREIKRNYARRHLAEIHEKSRIWRHLNPEKAQAQSKRYRTRRKEAGGRFSDAEWNLLLWVFKGRCAYCWQVPDRLETDHIIPLSKGGTNDIENILPVCKQCNAQKGVRVIHPLDEELLICQ